VNERVFEKLRSNQYFYYYSHAAEAVGAAAGLGLPLGWWSRIGIMPVLLPSASHVAVVTCYCRAALPPPYPA